MDSIFEMPSQEKSIETMKKVDRHNEIMSQNSRSKARSGTQKKTRKVYKGKSGGLYTIHKSKKTGKMYKKYLK